MHNKRLFNRKAIELHRKWCIIDCEEGDTYFLDFYKTKRGDIPVIEYITRIDDKEIQANERKWSL